MDFHFDDFIKAGVYLRAWSKKTVRTYRQGLNAFQMAIGENLQGFHTGIEPATPCGAAPSGLTKAHLDTFVVSMRQRGLSAGGCNMYIRTVNSYLSWLHEEGHIGQHLRIKLLPDPKKPLAGISEREVRLFLNVQPKGFFQLRTWTLVCLLLDTGIRIDESLTLTTENIDLDNLILKVTGKGNKERLVPFSTELRKVLFRYSKKRPIAKFFFSTKQGAPLTYRNTYRDVKTIWKRAGVEGKHIHPHAMRHCFSVNYMRKNKDIYRLSRILGHQSITTTQLYVRSMGIEQIAEEHSSPLVRF